MVTLFPAGASGTHQVGHLSWTIVSIVIVCGQLIHAPFMAHVGSFWFFFPAWLVINNDCWAYVCGMTFGKKIINKPFLALSPNKTWEGFIGATIITIIVGWYSSDAFSEYPHFICPADKLTLEIHPELSCTLDPLFEKQMIPLPKWAYVTAGMVPAEIRAKPIQLHGTIATSTSTFDNNLGHPL